MKLTDRVMLVTGGNSGIGKAVALASARQGATVAIAGRDRRRGEATAREVRALGRQGEFFEIDLADASRVSRLVADVIARFDRIDILVNNAAYYGQPMATADVTEDFFDYTVAVNLKASYFLGQGALEHMKERGSGRVVNVGSISGIVGDSYSSVYAATKGAIEMLTKCWAVEYGRFGINVNCIAPGTIDTPASAHVADDADMLAATLASTPQGRIGTVDEVAPAVVFLASDDASFIQGATLVIDGGWTAQ